MRKATLAPACRTVLAAAVALVPMVATGCGPFRPPKPTPAPELARLKERCPSFTVFSRERIPAGPRDFRGRPLVVVGVDHRYVRDLSPWLEFVEDRLGRPGDGYALLAILEDASPAMLAGLSSSLPRGVEFHCDPPSRWDRAYAESFRLRRRADEARLDAPRKADRLERKADRMRKDVADSGEPGLRRALGLVGEGPHVAVIGPDGRLLALVDGPRSEQRARDIGRAIDALGGAEARSSR